MFSLLAEFIDPSSSNQLQIESVNRLKVMRTYEINLDSRSETSSHTNTSTSHLTPERFLADRQLYNIIMYYKMTLTLILLCITK
ncbi:hypothetical protein FKM82_017908 [Ascaphus truei]